MKASYNPNTKKLTIEDKRIQPFNQAIETGEQYEIKDPNGIVIMWLTINKDGEYYTFDFDGFDDSEQEEYEEEHGEYLVSDILSCQSLEVIKKV